MVSALARHTELTKFAIVNFMLKSNMGTFKKILTFFGLFAFIVGAGCSLGWLGYHHEWFAFACSLVTIGFGLPTFIRVAKNLLG